MASLVLSGDTSGTVTLAAPSVAGTQSYTLPTGLPGTSGYALTSTTGGVMSWAAASGSPAGSTTQVQYNSSGSFAGSANMTFDGTGLTSGYFVASSATVPSNGMFYAGSNQLCLSTNTTERLRVDASGNVIVGATSIWNGAASNTLNVTSATSGQQAFVARNTASSTPFGIQITYSGASPNSAGSSFFVCNDTTNQKAVFYSNGGLANFSANNVNLSDIREKKNIALAGNYLDKINAIPVKTFLFNDQTDDLLNLGVIAQDVQQVAPELVFESDWGNKGDPKIRLSIYQTDLQYALMKAIQELSAANEALTARIAALEAK
jgi:hypothetical protein